MWEAYYIEKQNEYEIYYNGELMWHVHSSDMDLFIKNFKPHVTIFDVEYTEQKTIDVSN